VRAMSHRLADGRCRDCGKHDSYSAPDSCPRCALDRMGDRGYEIVVNPVAQFVHVNDEMWRQVAADIQSGAIKSDRFYILVGHNDGGSLGLPMGDLSPKQWEVASAQTAHRTARSLIQRYPQVWVVTTVGCWNAVLDTERQGRR
jgi:hypothetical protein